MKVFYYLITIQLLIALTANAQSNVHKIHRMDTTGNSWIETLEHISGSGITTYYLDTFYRYWTGTDTIIHTMHYKSVFLSRVYYEEYTTTANHSSTCNSYPIQPKTSLMGWIREDSAGKVFFQSTNPINPFIVNNHLADLSLFKKEVLLYDFNWKVGDTLPYTPYSADTFITITKIDSMKLDDNTYRKLYRAQSTRGQDINLLITEGIGSWHGLFGTLFLSNIFSHLYFYQQLYCYKYDSIHLMIIAGHVCPPAVNACDLHALNTIEHVPAKVTLNIYPNPTPNECLVKFYNPSKAPTSLELYDMQGQLKCKQELKLNIDIQKIDLTNLPSGVYLIRLNNKDMSISKQVIKQ